MRPLLLLLLAACGGYETSGNDATPEEEMPLRLRSAGQLVQVPPLDSSAVEVAPGDYPSLDAAIAANPNALDIVLGDDDYRSAWGTFAIEDRPGGTLLRPRTIRYGGPLDHLPPWQREGSEALVGRITVQGSTTRHWLLSGLSVPEKTGESNVAQGADHITIDRLWDHGTTVTYGFRVRLATNVTFQNFLFEDPLVEVGGGVETIGIAIGNIPGSVVGIRILNGEIKNFTDSIQTNDSATTPWDPVEVHMENLDLYITDALYLPGGLSAGENGIDLKAGSDRPFSTVIRNVRIWGFRRTDSGSSTGSGITIHRYAREVLIEGSGIGDGPAAITETIWPAGEDLSRPRNITLRRNWYYGINDYSGLDSGAVHRPVSNWSVSHETYTGCDYVLDVAPSGGYRAGGPSFESGVRIDTEIQVPGSSEANPYVESEETRNIHVTRSVVRDTYERKQHTGPEFAEGALEVSTGTYAQIRDEQARLIEALTPASASSVKFIKEKGEVDFRQWAQQNPAACFRRFSIQGSMRDEGPLVTNTDVETYRTDTVVTIAYPKQMGKYGADNVRDLQDLIEEDRFQIDDTIGHRGQDNWLGCQNFCRRSPEPAVDDGGSVWFVTLTFETEYQRAV